MELTRYHDAIYDVCDRRQSEEVFDSKLKPVQNVSLLQTADNMKYE